MGLDPDASKPLRWQLGFDDDDDDDDDGAYEGQHLWSEPWGVDVGSSASLPQVRLSQSPGLCSIPSCPFHPDPTHPDTGTCCVRCSKIGTESSCSSPQSAQLLRLLLSQEASQAFVISDSFMLLFCFLKARQAWCDHRVAVFSDAVSKFFLTAGLLAVS